MALKVGELFTELRLDNRGFDQGVDHAHRGMQGLEGVSDRAEGGVRRLGGAMRDMAKIAGGFVIAQALIQLPQILLGAARGAVMAASDINEAQSKVNVVFGESAAAVNAFASTSNRDLGISREAALSAAGTFGNLFTTMGLSQAASAQMSTDVVKLSSDLASFNNADPSEMLEKLRAGLVGEVEPLRAVGINLTAVAVEAKAMELGLADVNGEVSEGAKVIARHALIVEQSANAQGDFARTSDGMANAGRTIKASMADLSAELGQRLLPLVEPLVVRFSQWLPAAIDDFGAAMDRLMGGVSAFQDWVQGILSSGDILSSFLASLPSWFDATVSNIASMMGVGGYNAITAYAQGMMDSAATNVQAAIDYVADLVSGYLIGQSPPPKGPLSKIRQGGFNTMDAWVEGALDGAKQVEQVAQVAADAVDLVGERMELDAGRAGLEAATGNLEAMEAAAATVDDKINEVDRSLAEIDLALLEIDRSTADINEKYDDQLEPLQEQLDLLEKQRDLQAERIQLEQDLARTQVQAAELAALGDPERRAEIAGEMALNDIGQQRLDNEQAIADAQEKLTGGGKELTDAEREKLELAERALEISRKETQAQFTRTKDQKALTQLERDKLNLKLDQIDADLKANRAKQSAEPEEMTDSERKAVELQLEELQLRKELLDMIDAEAAAQATADGELMDAREKERDIANEIADINRDIAAIPILEEIEKIEAARRAELEPLEAQREAYEEQRGDLEYIRQQWQFLSGDVAAALSPLREAAKLAEDLAREAERAAKAAESEAKSAESAAKALERQAEAAAKKAEAASKDNSFEARQARLAGTGASCPPGWVMDEFGNCTNPAEEADKAAQKAKADAIKEAAKQAEGPAAAPVLDTALADSLVLQNVKTPETAAPAGGGGDTLSASLAGAQPESLGATMGAMFADGFVQRIGELIADNLGRIMGASIGGAIGGAVLGPVGATIGGLLGGFIGGGLQEALAERGVDLSGLQERVQESFDEYITPALERAAGFVEETVIPAFGRFAGFMEDTVLPALDSLGGFVRDTLLPVMERLFGFLDQHKGTIATIAGGVAVAVTAFMAISGVIAGVTAALAALAPFLTLVGVALMGGMPGIIALVTGALAALLSPVVLIAGAIALLAVAWSQNWGDIQGKAAAAWDVIRPILEAITERFDRFRTMIVPEILEAWDNIKTGITSAAGAIWSVVQTVFNAVSGFISQNQDTIMKYVEVTWGFIQGSIDNALAVISNAIQLVLNIIQGDWEGAWENVKAILAGAWESATTITNTAIELVKAYITDALPFIISSLKEWAGAFLGWIASDVLPYLWGKLQVIADDLQTWVTDVAAPTIIEKLKTWGAAFLNWITNDVLPFLWARAQVIADSLMTWITDVALPGIKEKLLTWGAAFLDFIRDEVIPYLAGKLGAILTTLGDWVTDNLQSVKDEMKAVGKGVVEGIWEGIKGMGGWLKDKLTGFVTDNIPGVIKDALKEKSPSRVMMPSGANAVRGLMAGALSEREALRSTFSGLAGDMVAGAQAGAARMPASRAALPAGSVPGVMSAQAAQRAGKAGGPGTIVVPINVGGRRAEEWVINTVNGHARKVYG